jgi:hypothetical protein
METVKVLNRVANFGLELPKLWQISGDRVKYRPD